jgi:hypothetical protein
MEVATIGGLSRRIRGKTMKRTTFVLRAAVLLATAGLATAAAAEENCQLAFKDEAPAAMQEEVAPPPPAAVMHPSDVQHDQEREEDWGLRQREAERAREGAKARAGRRLGYEDVGSGTDVRRGGDSKAKALSDQINRLGAAVSVQTGPCVCPDGLAAAVASGGTGAAAVASGAAVAATVASGGGGDLNRSQWDEEKYRKARNKRKKELEKREQELKKNLAKRRKDFLDLKAGKKTKKKLDEIEKERQKKQAELEKERIRREREKRANCCGYGEIQKILDWYLEEQEKINDGTEKKKEKAIDEDMKKSDLKGQKKYQDAREEHEDVEDQLRNIRRAEAIEREQQRKASMNR